MRCEEVIDLMLPADVIGGEHALLNQHPLKRQELCLTVAERHIIVFPRRVRTMRAIVRMIVMMGVVRVVGIQGIAPKV
jgi:hypothetical protein